MMPPSTPAGENVQVYVRVRPLNEVERGRGDQEVVQCTDDGRTVNFLTAAAPSVRGSGGQAPCKALTFDGALSGPSQTQVFHGVRMMQLLQDAISGYSVTILLVGSWHSANIPDSGI